MPRPLTEDVINGYITPGEECFMSGASQLDPSRDQEKRIRTSNHQPPNPISLTKMISNAQKYADRDNRKVGLRDRISCYQWTWFTMTMATGGIANVLHTLPYRSEWLYYVGTVFFLLNLCLFLMNVLLITMRFWLVRGSFLNSFTDQMECLFIPAAVVSYSAGTILINVCEYGIPRTGPWIQRTVELFYWIYLAVSVMLSACMYLILWSTQVFPIHTMTPVWVFPAYPLLLAAPFASNLIDAASKQQADSVINKIAIAFSAITVQGTGFLISFMVCAAFLYRLMTQKLPRDNQRPGVFISIGPSGFTAAGLVVLGMKAPVILPENFPGDDHAVYSLKLLAIMIGLWLWGLSFWFFLVSVGSLHKYLRPEHKMPFQMTWWSFVFPNTALVTATEALAVALNSDGLKIFGCVFAALLVIVWFIVLFYMLKALWKRQLLWPKDDDLD